MLNWLKNLFKKKPAVGPAPIDRNTRKWINERLNKK